MDDLKQEDGSEIDFTWRVFKGSSRRKKDKLIDPLGYTYVKKEEWKKTVIWRCSIRNRSCYCVATAKQTGDKFEHGDTRHKHQPFPYGYPTSKDNWKKQHHHHLILGGNDDADVSKRKKKRTSKELSDRVDNDQSELNCNTDNLLEVPSFKIEMAQTEFPAVDLDEPSDLNFEFNEMNIPKDFLQRDIITKSCRCLFFATDVQVELLKKAKRWYIHSTPEVPHPFKQLIKIHSIVKEQDVVKNVPLLFVFVSGKSKKDYKVVLKHLKKLLDNYRVTEVIMDFKDVMKHVIKKKFPEVQIEGCACCFMQTVKHIMQEHGFIIDDPFTPEFTCLKQLLVLPFLPHNKISSVVEHWYRKACSSQLKKVIESVKDNFVENLVWPPSTWSIFNRSICTSIDMESDCDPHHNPLHLESLYPFISNLYSQCMFDSQSRVKVVSEGKLKKYQTEHYPLPQRKVFETWDYFLQGDVSAKILLQVCSELDLSP